MVNNKKDDLYIQEKIISNNDDIVDAVFKLSEKMDEMNKLFIQKIQHTAHEEKVVDQMHRELQKYKEDMYSQLVTPILQDIIEVRESILRVSKVYRENLKGQDIPNKEFADYAYDMQDILEKNNINIYKSNKGDEFVAIKHRIIKKVITHDKELHGKILESLSSGYDYNGRIISSEKVVVYSYEELKEEN